MPGRVHTRAFESECKGMCGVRASRVRVRACEDQVTRRSAHAGPLHARRSARESASQAEGEARG